jgi:outer membrane lipoprotein SlyB
MVNRNIIALPLVVLLSITLVGCATPGGTYDPGKSTAAGAVGGAAAGAALGSIIGAATGSPATGAWVGAATGAIAGGVGGALYARHMNQQMKNRNVAVQQYNYNPSQGVLVDISQAAATPRTARPGQTVNMIMTYTVLTPENAPTQVTLYREVRLNGETMGQPSAIQVMNQNGTFQDHIAFTVPPNAGAGLSTVSNRVLTNYGSAERTSSFTVQ